MKKRRRIRPPKVEFEFTDLDLSAFGGTSVLAQTAPRFGLFELLDDAVSVKVGSRGPSDTETLWAMIASLARGHGALTDLDALRADRVASTVPGLRKVLEARRAGEWLGRLRAGDVKGLWRAAVAFAERVAPTIVDHEVRTKGYVPLFIDGTGIEVDGRLFQWLRKDYDGNRGHWLHATFPGGLWSAGQLRPGDAELAQVARLDRADGAGGHAGVAARGQRLLQGALVGECAARGWDY